MKHLIKDSEIIAYLESQLSKEQTKDLKRRMQDNNELNLLYHLQLAYNKGMTTYANDLIGKDDFVIDGTDSAFYNLGIAADKDSPHTN